MVNQPQLINTCDYSTESNSSLYGDGGAEQPADKVIQR